MSLLVSSAGPATTTKVKKAAARASERRLGLWHDFEIGAVQECWFEGEDFGPIAWRSYLQQIVKSRLDLYQ
jgi:hypothetical protein